MAVINLLWTTNEYIYIYWCSASKCLNFLDDDDGFNSLINIIIFDIETILNLLVIVDYRHLGRVFYMLKKKNKHLGPVDEPNSLKSGIQWSKSYLLGTFNMQPCVFNFIYKWLWIIEPIQNPWLNWDSTVCVCLIN